MSIDEEEKKKKKKERQKTLTIVCERAGPETGIAIEGQVLVCAQH